ncbi:MAG: hypothetical protein E6L02_07765 [Thaumarchaeota archaeon]|nr:MAG: hypothetical protein E6L02_07765 [Nitrososphaerota archaeon]
MGIFDIFRKPTKKELNREQTERIRQQGKDDEAQVEPSGNSEDMKLKELEEDMIITQEKEILLQVKLSIQNT